MAKLGELTEDEKSLFSHLNKGKETTSSLIDIYKLLFHLGVVFSVILRWFWGGFKALAFRKCEDRLFRWGETKKKNDN